MAVLKSDNGRDFYIDCGCGCDTGIRFTIYKDPEHDDYKYCMMTYTNGAFYTEQNESFWIALKKKLKKIWAIIRNKDFYYSDIYMTKTEFKTFVNYMNDLLED